MLTIHCSTPPSHNLERNRKKALILGSEKTSLSGFACTDVRTIVKRQQVNTMQE